jgi:hypothetical protein
MPTQDAMDEERRRQRRAMIRAHHPDTGGDAAEFIRLLHRHDDERPPTENWPEVRFVCRRRWWQRVAPPAPLLRRISRRPKRVV